VTPSSAPDVQALRASLGSPLRTLLVEMLLAAAAPVDERALGRRAPALPEDIHGCLFPLTESGWLTRCPADDAPEGTVAYAIAPDRRDALATELATARTQLSTVLTRLRAVHDDLLGPIVGDGPRIKLVFEQARVAARATVPTLLTGETGTGKDLIARAIHALSPRAPGPYVAVNVAALPQSLVASELFGHERGAFTGARRRRAGKLAVADGGTLFLDEIGELPLDGQVQLLRAVQERRVLPVGGTREIPTDFRLVAATHRDLHAMVAKGTFREDLLYRINVLEIRLPPLRERTEDIPALAAHFLALATERHGLPASPGFTASGLAALASAPWPGNVRELESAIYRATLLAGGAAIDAGRIQAALRGPLSALRTTTAPSEARPVGPVRLLDDVVRDAVQAAVARNAGNLSAAARDLDISRVTLYRHLRAAEAPR